MKRENNKLEKNGKGGSYMGYWTVAMGLLFISAFLWTEEPASPVPSIAAGVICVIISTLLILRARCAKDNSEK